VKTPVIKAPVEFRGRNKFTPKKEFGVDFINVLQAAFMHTDPTDDLTCLFALLRSVCIKAAH